MRFFWRICALALACPLIAMAQMNSTNYISPGDALSGGGGFSSSPSYQASDTISESATPPEQGMTSTNYRACSGFQCIGASLAARVTTSSVPCTSSSSGPLTQPLGTLTTTSVTTAVNRICVIVTATDVNSVTVTIRSLNASLKSSSTPADLIASSTATLVAGTEGYGVCASNATNGLTASAPYNGVCNTSSGHAVGQITTSPATIFSSSSDVTEAVGEILTKAAISSTTVAHTDYADTITIIVSATF